MKVLVPCLLKRWEPIIDYVGGPVKVLLSTSLELIDEFVRDTVYPGFVFVAVFTVTVAIVHDFIMDRGF